MLIGVNQFVMLMLLATLVVSSALALVYVKFETRSNFALTQTLREQRDVLDEQWQQLQLEQSTLARHRKVRGIAIKELNMTIPKSSDIQLIRRQHEGG